MKIKNIIILITLLYSEVTFSQLNNSILPINESRGRIEWSGIIIKSNQSKADLYRKITTWGLPQAQEVIVNNYKTGELIIKLLMPFKFKKTYFYMLYSCTLMAYNDSINYTMTNCMLLKNATAINKKMPFEAIDPKDKDFIKPFHEIADKMKNILSELEAL